MNALAIVGCLSLVCFVLYCLAWLAARSEPRLPSSALSASPVDLPATNEPDEYTHFAGTVICGGGAYEVWGKREASQDELATCFRDIVGKQFMFASPDFELVKVGD